MMLYHHFSKNILGHLPAGMGLWTEKKKKGVISWGRISTEISSNSERSPHQQRMWERAGKQVGKGGAAAQPNLSRTSFLGWDWWPRKCPAGRIQPGQKEVHTYQEKMKAVFDSSSMPLAKLAQVALFHLGAAILVGKAQQAYNAWVFKHSEGCDAINKLPVSEIKSTKMPAMPTVFLQQRVFQQKSKKEPLIPSSDGLIRALKTVSESYQDSKSWEACLCGLSMGEDSSRPLFGSLLPEFKEWCFGIRAGLGLFLNQKTLDCCALDTSTQRLSLGCLITR